MFKPFANDGGSSGQRRGKWESLVPVPSSAPPPPRRHSNLGAPSAVYVYRTADGEVAAYRYRFEHPENGKELRPLTFCKHSDTGDRAWRWKDLPPPRPLYNLEKLAARPEAPVIICEGEKAADAAERLLSDFVSVTSSGGSNGSARSDWSSLVGRRVAIWPDADEAGQKFALMVARELQPIAANVAMVIPPAGGDPGWDAADSEADGWDPARALALINSATPTSETTPVSPDDDRRAGGGRDGHDEIAELNKQYAVILMGDKAVILRESHGPEGSHMSIF